MNNNQVVFKVYMILFNARDPDPDPDPQGINSTSVETSDAPSVCYSIVGQNPVGNSHM